jgi:hypothetical protein
MFDAVRLSFTLLIPKGFTRKRRISPHMLILCSEEKTRLLTSARMLPERFYSQASDIAAYANSLLRREDEVAHIR